MKKIQKTMMMLAALLMAGAAMTSCSSNEEMIANEQPTKGEYTITVNATMDGDMTRALGLDGTALKTTWTTGDKVMVFDNSNIKLGELTAQSTGATTTLKGSLNRLPKTAGEELNLATPTLDIDYTTQGGSFDGLNNYNYCYASIEAEAIGDEIFTTAAKFEPYQSIYKFTLVDQSNNPLAVTSLTINIKEGSVDRLLQSMIFSTMTVSQGPITITPVPATSTIWAALVKVGEDDDNVNFFLTASDGTKNYEYTSATLKVKNGKYYTVMVKMKESLTVTNHDDSSPVIPAAGIFSLAEYNYYDVSGSGVGTLNFAGSGGLYLNGATFEDASSITSTGSLVIDVTGANTIINTTAEGAIDVGTSSTVKFMGDGTLTITAKTSAYKGIRCYNYVGAGHGDMGTGSASVSLTGETDNGDGTTTYVYTVATPSSTMTPPNTIGEVNIEYDEVKL